MTYYTINALGIRYYITAEGLTFIEVLGSDHRCYPGPTPFKIFYKFLGDNDIDGKDIAELKNEPDRKYIDDKYKIRFRRANANLKFYEGVFDIVLFPEVNGKRYLSIELTVENGYHSCDLDVYDHIPTDAEIIKRINYIYGGLYYELFAREDKLDPEDGTPPRPAHLSLDSKWQTL
ncbi:MAG: hypothetical protein IKE64_14960 [Thermoguttaceae bacterium]|nr:hypothetical protein [Thermoguttaceae bacterium]